eukprot:6200438-Amphidinium_carterae.1
MIDGCAKQGDPEAAHRWLNTMVSSKHSPDQYTCTSAMHSFAHHGDTEAAEVSISASSEGPMNH